MSSLDNLPEDQRAVLSLVLQRGRGYDEIAKLLSIDRAAVRERALAAFDALGPQTGIEVERRALITDYLLGQLPPAIAQQTRDRLATSPGERAWARVLASELAPLAGEPLPEIPTAAATSVAQPDPDLGAPAPRAPVAAADSVESDRAAAETALGTAPPAGSGPPRSSRLGGMILLIGGAVVAIAVVVVIVATSGGSSKSPSAANSSSSSTTSSSASGASTTTATRTPTVVAQINLKPPTAASNAAGVAEVLKEGANRGIAIVAQHMAPNTTKPPNAYAVWLYNSPTDAHLLGFVNPGVGKTGRLSTAGGLPSDAAHFKQLIITVETKADPKTPGIIVLAGQLAGVS